MSSLFVLCTCTKMTCTPEVRFFFQGHGQCDISPDFFLSRAKRVVSIIEIEVDPNLLLFYPFPFLNPFCALIITLKTNFQSKSFFLSREIITRLHYFFCFVEQLMRMCTMHRSFFFIPTIPKHDVDTNCVKVKSVFLSLFNVCVYEQFFMVFVLFISS